MAQSRRRGTWGCEGALAGRPGLLRPSEAPPAPLTRLSLGCTPPLPSAGMERERQ